VQQRRNQKVIKIKEEKYKSNKRSRLLSQSSELIAEEGEVEQKKKGKKDEI
jgi:hypothetical protein